MKHLHWIFISATVLTMAATARAGDVLDRIVATVNGQIILQSDWQDAMRYEAFVDGRPLEQLPAADRKAALDRLINQELLREQMHSANFQHASEAEVSQRLREIRKQYPDAESEDGWRSTLARYGFSEEELKQRVSLQLDLMRLVDNRLRPNINIDAQSIERYYNQELLPQLRQAGAKEAPLAEVSPQIKELLTQQKLNELLVGWLQDLRSGSDIRTPAMPAESQGELR